ncbi:FERM and PDZ domain-containing protein 4 isoform X1 [Cloeon dipterum]|uniref:FERM and PDZ domain-containing protein 4 isoform X1 n=1 Tax=Cloeon dipterum TaxID=197152 RepID=UPI0032209293
MEDGGPLAYPRQVKPGWTAHVNRDGRLYYCNHLTKTASWLPPADTYDVTSVLPFGWEEAVDSNGHSYFINHVNQTTIKDPPPKDWAPEEAPPKPRRVTLTRDGKQGFGFVAGSEKPVIVRFVTDNGPSDGKLLPGDQILEINGEDVRKVAREHAIQLIRSCPEKVELIVCQPPLDNSARKSALLSVAKKAKLRSHPSRVRFAEGVVVNGTVAEKGVALMPNVLKVFLENGQTKSFKYDGSTTVQDVTDSLLQKLGILAGEHFCLALEHVTGRKNKLTLLQPHQHLAKIAARPGSHNLRCLFRVVFVPSEPEALLHRDPVAFEYLYLQCCNDVVQERFAPELKYETALRLAALHIQQHAMANNLQGKLGAKNIEKEFGLERFVPISLMESMKRKELRKLIGHFLKLCTTQPMSDIQAKLYYLHIISDLPSYGAKCFSTNIKDINFQETNMETVVLISPKFGISQIAGMRSATPMPLADIHSVRHVSVSKQDELSTQVTLHLLGADQICLSLEEKDAEELVLVLRGYFHLLTGLHLSLDCPPEDPTPAYDAVPPYQGFHLVVPDWWSYIAANNKCQLVNLAVPPPYHAADGKTVDSNMNSMLRNANKENRQSSSEDSTSPEASEEARQRLSEMHRLVLASEQYLNDHGDEKESDSEGSSQMSSLLDTEQPELKHSDSLLLLAHGGHKANLEEEMSAVVRSLDINGDTTESSDTDSMSTPTSSPSHNKAGLRPGSLLKPSDSSFGLHSPDNVLPRAGNSDMKEILLRLQQDTSLPYHFAEGTLYLDPDIIDLTMIPPPITPDNLALSFLDSPSSPPTPFADQLPPLLPGPHHEWDQDMLDELLDSNLDLDEFLATVVVPAPNQSGITELTPEEVSAYIIPPPPPPSQSNILASLSLYNPRNHYVNNSARSSLIYRNRNNMVKFEKISTSQAKEKINQLSEHLLNLAEQCRGYIAAGGGENEDVNLYRATQTKLCNEVRALVASSKLLVQAAAEGLRANLEGTLANCLNSLNNIFSLSEELCVNTDAPSHTMSLILRSRDVCECLVATINSIDNPKSTSNVQKCAEDLVNALTSLLKGLKVLGS